MRCGAIGQTAAVGQDMAHGHWLIGRLGTHVDTFTGDPDLLVSPLGNITRHRIIQLEVTSFVKLHQRYRGDRFAHGVNSEDSIVCHRFITFDIHLAKTTEIASMAVTPYQYLATSNFLRVDVVALDMIGDPLETICCKTSLFRFYSHVFPHS